MKVGIMIKKPENIFSNGCVQQSLFMKKIIQNAGFEVHFLSIEPTYNTFELTSEPIIMTDEKYDFSEFFCIILASLVLIPSNNANYIENLQKYNLVVINMVCGNLSILNQEEFVFNVHKIIHNYTLPYFSMNWVLEMYEHSRDYVQFLTSKPTEITPYVWDPDIIHKYLKQNNISINKEKKNNSKVNLLIFEPNMSIHKNALVPLLICEEFHKRFPDKLNKVYLFCASTITETNKVFLQNLSIFPRIESFGRIIMPYILNVIEKNNNFLNIGLSYTLMNNLNFLHLEFFYLGLPIIHNCQPFQHNKMYFNDNDLSKAVGLIETTRLHFDKDVYMNDVSKILQEFSSTNTARIEQYKKSLKHILNNFEINHDKNCGFCFIITNSNNNSFSELILELTKKYNKPSIEVYLSKQHDLQYSPDMFNANIAIKQLECSNLTKENILSCSSFRKIYLYSDLHTTLNNFEIYTK
jgi:hypothetical protein